MKHLGPEFCFDDDLDDALEDLEESSDWGRQGSRLVALSEDEFDYLRRVGVRSVEVLGG